MGQGDSNHRIALFFLDVIESPLEARIHSNETRPTNFLIQRQIIKQHIGIKTQISDSHDSHESSTHFNMKHSTAA